MIVRQLKSYELRLIRDNPSKSLRELGLVPDISLQQELEVDDGS